MTCSAHIALIVDNDGIHLIENGKCILSADQMQSNEYIVSKLRKMLCSGDL